MIKIFLHFICFSAVISEISNVVCKVSWARLHKTFYGRTLLKKVITCALCKNEEFIILFFEIQPLKVVPYITGVKSFMKFDPWSAKNEHQF